MDHLPIQTASDRPSHPTSRDRITDRVDRNVAFKHVHHSGYTNTQNGNIWKQHPTVACVLTGRNPPRKSDVSVWRWQLTECKVCSSRFANNWQVVVLPHLQKHFEMVKCFSNIPARADLNIWRKLHDLPRFSNQQHWFTKFQRLANHHCHSSHAVRPNNVFKSPLRFLHDSLRKQFVQFVLMV